MLSSFFPSFFSYGRNKLNNVHLKVKNPGPVDQALVGPWKGLLAIAGVETQNSEARSQESEWNDVASRRHILYFPAEPKAITLF